MVEVKLGQEYYYSDLRLAEGLLMASYSGQALDMRTQVSAFDRL